MPLGAELDVTKWWFAFGKKKQVIISQLPTNLLVTRQYFENSSQQISFEIFSRTFKSRVLNLVFILCGEINNDDLLG